jgi:hypothetical protein
MTVRSNCLLYAGTRLLFESRNHVTACDINLVAHERFITRDLSIFALERLGAPVLALRPRWQALRFVGDPANTKKSSSSNQRSTSE